MKQLFSSTHNLNEEGRFLPNLSSIFNSPQWYFNISTPVHRGPPTMPGHALSDMLIKFLSTCVTGEALFSEILLDHRSGIKKSIIDLLMM